MGFGIDMAKAREIHKDKIRAARAEKFKELDIEFQKALETGASTTDIVAKAEVPAPGADSVTGRAVPQAPSSQAPRPQPLMIAI